MDKQHKLQTAPTLLSTKDISYSPLNDFWVGSPLLNSLVRKSIDKPISHRKGKKENRGYNCNPHAKLK